MAAARLRSVWVPLAMAPLRIIWYWAFIVLFIIMRWLRCSFCKWPRFCLGRQCAMWCVQRRLIIHTRLWLRYWFAFFEAVLRGLLAM